MEPSFGQEWVYWMLLAHSESRALRQRFRQQNPDDIARFLRDQPEWDALEPRLVQESIVLHELLQQGGRMLIIRDEAYPQRLRALQAFPPPPVLYALGYLGILEKAPLVALAGSRNASEGAQQQAQTIAKQLAERGYAVITGFARGIDQIAATSALQAGGEAIGVLPQGLLTPLTQQLARDYMQPLNDDRLLFLSELHPRANWTGSFAMMRNRIIAALAECVIIIESGPEKTQKNGKTVLSGTYQCALIAHKMGRPVYALDLPAEGNQQLLQQGVARPWTGDWFAPTHDAQLQIPL
ncbi:MAG: DNA-protecting protein DprA [Fimbriimonadales bacterium]|nr:DNA-protecting protein DprA [Fimbriimonadales bacterium]